MLEQAYYYQELHRYFPNPVINCFVNASWELFYYKIGCEGIWSFGIILTIWVASFQGVLSLDKIKKRPVENYIGSAERFAE